MSKSRKPARPRWRVTLTVRQGRRRMPIRFTYYRRRSAVAFRALFARWIKSQAKAYADHGIRHAVSKVQRVSR